VLQTWRGCSDLRLELWGEHRAAVVELVTGRLHTMNSWRCKREVSFPMSFQKIEREHVRPTLMDVFENVCHWRNFWQVHDTWNPVQGHPPIPWRTSNLKFRNTDDRQRMHPNWCHRARRRLLLFIVCYESIKRDPKRRLIYEFRCDERLNTTTLESTRLTDTRLVVYYYYESRKQLPEENQVIVYY
jgi:hypothetical protein